MTVVQLTWCPGKTLSCSIHLHENQPWMETLLAGAFALSLVLENGLGKGQEVGDGLAYFFSFLHPL